MVYVIGGMKYNIGKVRTSVNFALYLANIKQRSVLLIDADPSTLASEYLGWKNMIAPETELAFTNLDDSSLKEKVAENKNEYDDIVIDSGVGENLKYSLDIAGRLIVPFCAKDLGLWTVWTLTNVERMIYNALDENPELKAYSILINKVGNEDKITDLVKALKRSQFLELLCSETLQDTMFEEQENLENSQPVKSVINDQDLDIFEEISS